MTKKCKRCEEVKTLNDFSLSPKNIGGHANLCKPCVCRRNREYWRTPTGRMSYIYAGEVSSSKVRGHLVPQYSRKELTDWAFASGLEALVTPWEGSGYQKDYAPSVDRLDPIQGYVFGNIRLVTWAENNDKAYEDRKACLHVTKQNRKVQQLTLECIHIKTFDSISAAARETGIQRININDVCRGKKHCKTAGGYLWEYVN